MPHPRKFFTKDSVYFITSSTLTGLPFIPNLIINTILRGIIARAQKLYGQEICHFVFMANHFHLILLVTNPETVPDFIGYIKAKSANAINRLLKKGKQPVWCDGFDSPVLLDAATVIEKIIYTYANPAKARLVDSISQYPGISSWNAFTKEEKPKYIRWIMPSTITPLPSPDMTHTEQVKYLISLQHNNKAHYKLTFSPNAWISSFPELREQTPEQINNKIISRVKNQEAELAKEKPAMGSAQLQKQPLDKEHTRKKDGKRMICLGSAKEKRINFISWFKAISAKAAEIIYNAIHLNIHEPLPPGFFAPGKVLHANFFNFMAWLHA